MLNFLKFRNLSSSCLFIESGEKTLISASTFLQYLLDLNITGIALAVSVYSQPNIFWLMTACVPLIKEPYSVALLFSTVYCVHISFRNGCSKTDRWDLTSSSIDMCVVGDTVIIPRYDEHVILHYKLSYNTEWKRILRQLWPTATYDARLCGN